MRRVHSFANQQQAAFIPTPNCESPLASAGGSATRNARSQSVEAIPAALSRTVIEPPSARLISISILSR